MKNTEEKNDDQENQDDYTHQFSHLKYTPEECELMKDDASKDGDHKSYLLKDRSNQIQYFVKSIEKKEGKNDPISSIYLEVLAYRAIKKLAPNQHTAETKFLLNEDGNTAIISTWIEDFIPFYKIGHPYILEDRIVVRINNEEKELEGYLLNLLIMRFLGIGDSVGRGANTGYIIEEDGTISLAQIDLGGGFSFADYEEYNPLMYLSRHIEQILYKEFLSAEYENMPGYSTYIPLEMIDLQNIDEFNDIYPIANNFIKKIILEFNIKDLLINEIRYEDIIKSEKLKIQLGEAIYTILSLSNRDLIELIYNNMPDVIDGVYLNEIKENILNGLLDRQMILYNLYQEEYEFYCNYIGEEPEEFFIYTGLENIEHVDLINRQVESMLEAYLSYIERNENFDRDRQDELSELVDVVYPSLAGEYNQESFEDNEEEISRMEYLMSITKDALNTEMLPWSAPNILVLVNGDRSDVDRENNNDNHPDANVFILLEEGFFIPEYNNFY